MSIDLQTQQVHQSTKDIRLTIPDIGYVFLELETFALSKIYHNKSRRIMKFGNFK